MIAEVSEMCLGVPGQIISVEEKTAIVDFWGTHKSVKLDILEEPVTAGDYIVNHAGYAIRRIKPEDVLNTLEMYETVLAEAGEDPIIRDIIEQFEAEQEVELV
jgi:hydrogenase expression/formation protein HypC